MLNTEKKKMIKTPLLNELEQIPTYGYFIILNIKASKTLDLYYDVWILITNKENFDELDKLAHVSVLTD